MEEASAKIREEEDARALILEGGKRLRTKHTRQRDEVVTWLLFETGGRISEVVGLTLDDWVSQGTHTKARTFNKGSLGRRTKMLSFHEDTVVLLRRYFDEGRIHFDPHGYSLDLYLAWAARQEGDRSTVPLVFTPTGPRLTPEAD